MKRNRPATRFTGFPLTTDAAIGAFGGCLAAGALAFGVYMNVHGPSASFGTSHEFTVFAQLAPHARRQAAPAAEGDPELDTLATASIPARSASPNRSFDAGNTHAPSIVVEAADRDSATIDIDGSLRMVRLGDSVPGVGNVVAIVPGARPTVRTSRGVVLTPRDK